MNIKKAAINKDLLLLAGLFLLAALPFLPLLVQSDYLIISRDIDYFFPHEIVNRQLLAGDSFPLWNPYFGAGSPQLGKIQAGMFYPISMLLRWLPLVPMFNWDAVLHIFFAGAGVFVLLRRWRLQRTGAFAAALVFMFSGVMVPRVIIGHISVFHVVAWSGWVLWAYDRLLQRRTWGDLLLTVWFTMLIILGGHPQFSAMVLFIPAAYFGLFAWRQRRSAKTLLTALGYSLLVGILTAGLLAPHLWSYLEWTALSSRGQGVYIDDLASMLHQSFTPEGLLTIIAPLILYAPVQQQTFRITAPFSYWETSPFITLTGLFCLALSVGLPRSQHRSRQRFLWGLVGVGLFMSLGNQNPLYPWLYQVLPVFRAPGRFLLWWSFGLSLLIGFSLNALLRQWPVSRRLRRGQWVAGLIFLPSLAAAIGYYFWGVGLIENLVARGILAQDTGSMAQRTVPHTLALLTVTSLGLFLWLWRGQSGRLSRVHWRRGLLLLIVIESYALVWLTIKPYPALSLFNADHPLARLDIDPGELRIADRRLPPNYLTPTFVYAFNGDEFYLLDYLYWTGIERAEQLTASAFVATTEPIHDPHLVLVQVRPGAYLYEHVDNLPRIYGVPAVLPVEEEVDALDYVQSDAFAYGRQAVVTLDRRAGPPDLPATAAEPAGFSARYRDYGNNTITAVVTTDRPVLVVFAEMDYPGWEATLDGRPVPIYRSNFAFRGIVVATAGTHEITMRFRPRVVRDGLVVSGVTLAVVVLISLVQCFRWRRRNSAAVNA